VVRRFAAACAEDTTRRCCDAGELYDQIQRKVKLALDEATFYASEIVDILVYLREQRVRTPAGAQKLFAWMALPLRALSGRAVGGQRCVPMPPQCGAWKRTWQAGVRGSALALHRQARGARAQVVHRDLKPENLLLDAGGHLCLTDFGSAKHLDAPAAPACPAGAGRGKDLHAGRRSSSLVGSADYVSPEVRRGSRAARALACVLACTWLCCQEPGAVACLACRACSQRWVVGPVSLRA
jgi:serine/threonine protein kinase